MQINTMLLKEGHEVIGFDNLTFGYHALPHLGNKKFSFIFGDITQIENKNLFNDIDGIIHLAIFSLAYLKNPGLANNVNLIATKKLQTSKKKHL